jgi:hypothetical protein
LLASVEAPSRGRQTHASSLLVDTLDDAQRRGTQHLLRRARSSSLGVAALAIGAGLRARLLKLSTNTDF